jgi:hypothetical protein
VGSGLSGVYTAYRLATAQDSPYAPYEVCLFDSSTSFGGRILTIEDEQGKVFEMGIDSFDTAKNPLFTELVDFLGLNMDCVWGTVNASRNMKREIKTGQNQQQQQQEQQVKSFFQRQTGQGGVQTTTMENNAETTAPATTENENNTEITSAGLTAGSTEECRPAILKVMSIRDKLVYSNASAGNLPFKLTETVEKLKNLPEVAFKKVMADYVSSEELDSISTETDAGARWEKVAAIIKSISNSSIKYKGVPID